MPRRNRVDPWGDLHAVAERGLFTGNRGCVVDDHERVVRHHGSSLWIVCLTEFRDWRVALARPRRWTPLFFLDDAVALAAGHRPCATCRRDDYRAYRDAVGRSVGADTPLLAWELNARLHTERHRRGRGLDRANDRLVWSAPYDELPNGTVVVSPDDAGALRLVLDDRLWRFGFGGWSDPIGRPIGDSASVLTPPTSVGALRNGYSARLHVSASPTLRTERLTATPLRVEDADATIDIYGDERMYEFTGGAPPTLAALRARYGRLVAGADDEFWSNWIVRLDGEAVGAMQATVTLDGTSADVAWEVGVDHWGRGYASEAARAVVEWLKAVGVSRVSANINPAHDASGRVAAHAGLRPTSARVDGEVVWALESAPPPGP